MTSNQEVSNANKESLPAVEKREEKASIVELKNGKVIVKQKLLSFEKHSETLQEIVEFRALLEDAMTNKAIPLPAFPEQHKPLIAKLAHESDKNLSMLTKHIHKELLPTLDGDEDEIASATSALPLSLVEIAIQEVLTRNNYGFDGPVGFKPPAAICVWRWEVRAEHWNWLPKNAREKAEARRTERVKAKEDLRLLLEALPEEERNAIIDPKGVNKLPIKELNKPSIPPSSILDGKDEDQKFPQSLKVQGRKKAEEMENEKLSEAPNGSGQQKKVQDTERTTKEKERQEKRAARAEKEKKEKDSHVKSKFIMAQFFLKPKPNLPSLQDSAAAGPSRIQSDFEKTFRPFVLQKDKVLAPINWFLSEKKSKKKSQLNALHNEVIVVIDSDEEDDVKMVDPEPTAEELAHMSNRDHLNSILSSLPPSATPAGYRGRPLRVTKAGYKVFPPVSVRNVISQLSEAEVSGNDEEVRALVSKLRNRDMLPAKAFHFHTDARPGYFGTWTRSSRVIGPRKPFAKDTLVFDYSYDSGEEWEDEPAGEDVVDEGEEEENDTDSDDSDADSWLVEDDDEELNLSLLDQNSLPPLFDQPIAPPPKRKAENSEQKIEKKRKVVIPLVPFAKGPIFESSIGQCQYEPFKQYSIQLFNDTPFSVDPFTFVSTCMNDYRAHIRQRNQGGLNNEINANQAAFAVPAVPPRLGPNGWESSVVDNGAVVTPAPKKRPVVPKSVFPDALLTVLFDKISLLQASSINSLVESIYLDLRDQKVKKIAIETKVREVSEKCKIKRVWVVKPELLQQAAA